MPSAASLFLPIVTRIDRHRAPGEYGDADIDQLIASAMTSRTEGDHAAFASAMFALAQDAGERFAFQLASILAGPLASGDDVKDRLADAARQLRRLADATPVEASPGIATDIASVARTVSKAPWLWLEALFIVESWLAGPQFSDMPSRSRCAGRASDRVLATQPAGAPDGESACPRAEHNRCMTSRLCGEVDHGYRRAMIDRYRTLDRTVIQTGCNDLSARVLHSLEWVDIYKRDQ